MSVRYRGKRQQQQQRRTGRMAVTVAGSLVILLALLWTVGCHMASDDPRPAGSQPPAASGAPSGSAQTDPPAQEGPQGEDAIPAGNLGTDVTPEPPQVAEPEVPAYDFSQPAPQSEPVDNSYFDDAAFVGDSRTDGFMIYSGIGTGTNLTSNGLSIFKLEEKKALTIDGVEYTLLEALALEQYGKVYLSLGVNELGYFDDQGFYDKLGYFDDQGFYDNYCKAIDEIRKLQPNAVIYIQGLIPLNEEQIAATTGRTYLTNDHLRVYNDLMKQAAQEKQVVYLDLYSVFVDENGALPAGAATTASTCPRSTASGGWSTSRPTPWTSIPCTPAAWPARRATPPRLPDRSDEDEKDRKSCPGPGPDPGPDRLRRWGERAVRLFHRPGPGHGRRRRLLRDAGGAGRGHRLRPVQAGRLRPEPGGPDRLRRAALLRGHL